MSFPSLPYAPAPSARPAPPRPTLSGLLAWAVIVAVCGYLLYEHVRPAASASAVAATRPGSAELRPVDVQSLIAGRYAVGTAKLFGADPAVAAQLAGVLPPTAEGKIAGAVLTGELKGPDAARRLLESQNDPDARTLAAFYSRRPDPATTQAATQAVARPPKSLDEAYDRGGGVPVYPTVTADEVRALRPRLNWFADLAASNGEPDATPARAAVLAEARRTVFTLVAAFCAMGLAALLGLGLFVTAIVLIAVGKLRFPDLRPAGPTSPYVEGVAIYLAGFVGLGYVVEHYLADSGVGTRLVLQGGLVLLAALWPLLRRVPLDAYRRDLGVHTGRGVVAEVLAGAAGYLAGLPVLAVGLGITLLLARFTATDVSHPITNQITAAPPLLLLGLAAVFAPLTEELMFRGALVGHLRAGVGVVLAALVSGLVFAAVHPQGWAAIPTIGGIGAVLALIRQWRGTLIASITAHAINNGFVIGLLLLATR